MGNQKRRNFLKNTLLGTAGLSLANLATVEAVMQKENSTGKRKIWITSLTQNNIEGEDYKSVIRAAISQMGKFLPSNPDVFCLPEAFHVAGIKGNRNSSVILAEDGSGNILEQFQLFAATNKCYIICPCYTSKNGKFYNAAVVIDRQGKKTGEYRKARLTVDEISMGLTPGPLEIPVFQTDFGVIGIQICYDIEWPEGWHQLREKGAEIVFWPSAFGGGKKVNTKAWENQYCVVSSTRKGMTRICDITGEELAVSGIWDPDGICASVNLEKAFLHSWPYSLKFPEIRKKYGRDVKCYSLHEEEFSIIESMSADLKVNDILKEFDLKTYREHLQLAEKVQDKNRV